MNIPFKIGEMDFDLFLHGYGKNCCNAEVTIGSLDLPVTDRNGSDANPPSMRREKMVSSSRERDTAPFYSGWTRESVGHLKSY